MKLKNILLVVLGALVLSLTSCEDWLEAQSKRQVQLDDQLTTEEGFKEALLGIYINLGDKNLYGMDLTWRFAEILSMVYANITNHPDKELWYYDYKHFSQYTTIYRNLYKVIANCNTIIKAAEENPGIMDPILDSCIRGEVYAIRAYCHLDILRFYGKGNLANRNIYEEKCLPYVTNYSKDVVPRSTYNEYLANIEKDCLKAIELLEADPQKNYNNRPEGYYDIVSSEKFIHTTATSRKYRMNYYAACGLLARAMMWDGRPEAREKAKQWAAHAVGVDLYGDDPADKASWWKKTSTMTSTVWKCDRSFCHQEPLFNIYTDLTNNQRSGEGGFFDPWNTSSQPGVLCLTPNMNEEIFELESKGVTEDWRRKFVTAVGSYYAINKYRQIDRETGNEGRATVTPRSCGYDCIAMIRPTEMMFILAECAMKDGDMQKCALYLNTVRHWRNVTASHDIPANLNNVQMENEIMKEYRRDLLCEGQTFLYYKRLGYTKIAGYANEMTDTQYVLPLPEDEEILANK